MGIEGLLRNLQPILVPVSSDPQWGKAGLTSSQNMSRKKKEKAKCIHNIREFVNGSLAVDASSWLHKAGYSISETLVEAAEKNPGGDWQRDYPQIVSCLTNYIVKRCDELFKYAGIAHITLVYDGERRCPLKMDTNDSRNSKRQANLAKARLLKSQGRLKEASEVYRACVKVPFSLSMIVMQKVMGKNNRLASVVAPFEADAQLAKLCLDGVCQAVITEDSDLLVYSASIGVPFPIIFKLDRNTGACDIVSMRWLFPPPPLPPMSECSFHQEKENISPNFFDKYLTSLKKGSKLSQYLQAFQLKENAIPGYGRRLFVQACVLAGCDYTVNSTLAPDGIGLITACKLIAEHAHRPHEERFQHALREWKGSTANTGATLESYEELLAKSEAVFYYHYVRCNNSHIAAPLQKTSSFVSLNDNESSSVNNLGKQHVQLPNLRRFLGSTSFLGFHEKISSKHFASTNMNLRGWMSKRSDFLCISPEKARVKPKPQQKAIEPPVGNSRPVLQELTNDPKACSMFNSKLYPIESIEDGGAKGSEDGLIDSFSPSMDWLQNEVRASKREICRSPSFPISPRKRRRTSSPKKVTLRQHQNQNRFSAFAHEPEGTLPFSPPTVNPMAAASLNVSDRLCNGQKSSYDGTLPKQLLFSATTGLISPYQGQRIESFSDSEEEVPSSYPGELEKKSMSNPHLPRVQTNAPFDGVDSIQPTSQIFLSDDQKEASTECIVWTDDDSDCCELEDKFIPIFGLGNISTVNNINGNEVSKRKASIYSFSPSRKRAKTNCIQSYRQPKLSVFSKISRKHEVKGSVHPDKFKSRNNHLIRSWLQPLKGKKCRTERSIKDFFLPIIPTKNS